MKYPPPLGPRYFMGVDPSLRGTGWSIVREDLVVVSMGVIRTRSRPKSKQTQARKDGDDALLIHRSIAWLLSTYRPSGPVCQEANAGSKSVRAAQCLARAQQACLDAAHRAGTTTLLCSPQRLKKVSPLPSPSKADIRDAVQEFFAGDWDSLLAATPGYPDGEVVPPSMHDNAYDSLGALQTFWNHPALQEIRGE